MSSLNSCDWLRLYDYLASSEFQIGTIGYCSDLGGHAQLQNLKQYLKEKAT